MRTARKTAAHCAGAALAAITLATGAPGHAADAPRATVTRVVHVASYAWMGTAGGRAITVSLDQRNHALSGFASYADSPTQDFASQQEHPDVVTRSFALYGSINGRSATLTATLEESSNDPLADDKSDPAGTWHLTLARHGATGTWSRGDKAAALVLHHDDATPLMPFDVYAVTHVSRAWTKLKASRDCWGLDEDDQKSVVNEIDLYRDGRLVQALKGFKAIGWCNPEVPIIQDVNFDGHPDILIDADNAVGRHHPIYWQYQPATGRFARSDALDGIGDGSSLPSFDDRSKTIAVEHFSTGTSDRLQVTYGWRGGKLVALRKVECDVPEDSDDFKCSTLQLVPAK